MKITSTYLLSNYLKARPSAPPARKAPGTVTKNPTASMAQRTSPPAAKTPPTTSDPVRKRAEITSLAKSVISAKHQESMNPKVTRREREFIQQLFAFRRRMDEEEALGFLGQNIDVKA